MSETPTAAPPDPDAIKRASANPLALVDQTYTAQQIDEIARYVGVAKDHEAFRPFLGTAAHLGLSPILGEIWLIPSTRWDEDKQTETPTLRAAVGRDGFLKYAEDQDNYGGLRSNTVCANDTFELEDDGREVTIVHRFKSLGPEATQGDESKWRGPVVGAWAKVFFTDARPPFFYFAPIHEHLRTVVVDGKTEPAGAWSYESAMSQKAAQSYVLRVGFRITGVVPIDELRQDEKREAGTPDAAAATIADDPMVGNEAALDRLEGIDPELKKTLTEALRAINGLSPFSWPPSKLNLRLRHGTDDDVRAVLAEVEAEYKALRDRQDPADAAAKPPPDDAAAAGDDSTDR
jgi:hypothetical protein